MSSSKPVNETDADRGVNGSGTGGEAQPEEPYPFHIHCDICKKAGRCLDITVEPDYILVTNFWNERENIVPTIRRVGRQTKKPKVWLFIDDGSTDGSGDVVRQHMDSIPGTEVWLESMPAKEEGDLDTIGRAYQKVVPRLRDEIDSLGIKYFAVMDVDTEPCPNYFARMLSLMEEHTDVGAAAGTPLGEEGKRHTDLPMGGGKVVRWSIVRQIDRYWDPAPDTLLNIKALAAGYKVRTWPVPMRLIRRTSGFSRGGAYRVGRLNYYVGRPFWGVFWRAVWRAATRQHGTHMLRGYFHESWKGTWRCTDPDVREYYSIRNDPISGLIDVLRQGRKRI